MTYHPTPVADRFAAAEDVLHAAQTVIAEKGWCQNAYRDHRGRVCLMGALGIGAQAGTWNDPAVRLATALVADAMLTVDPGPVAVGHHIDAWNDVDGRTIEDVTLTLKHAIAAAEDQQDPSPLARYLYDRGPR